MKAIWKGEVLAESEDTVVVEGYHYFPRETIKEEHFQESDHTTTCPWKGRASYFDVVVDGARKVNAAWCYPEPRPAAKAIVNRVAFWKGVEVAE